jgi:LEA14-like dessication related protein
MNKGLVLLGGAGVILYTIIKSKKNAWDKVEISLKKFSVKGFTGLTLNCVLTISLKNPTKTALQFTSIEGVISTKDLKIGTFTNSIGSEIAPNKTTDIDIAIFLDATKLTSSIVELIASGYKLDVLIDTMVTVSGVKLPVRQVFKLDFSMIKDLIVKSSSTKDSTTNDAADFNLPAENGGTTGTIAQGEVFTETDRPDGFIAANAIGETDPNGGVVITLPPPDGVVNNNDWIVNVSGADGSNIMVLPSEVDTYKFNTTNGFTIGKINGK